MGVLHVGGRVAVHRQHLVVAEHVVARAILREVGVLERPDADGFGDPLPLLGRKLRPGRLGVVIGADDRQRPLDSLVEQPFQADSVAGARLERPAVLAEHRAEADVLEFDVGVAPAAGGREELVEMQALPMIDDVKNRIGSPGLYPILDRGQIGRAVEKRPVLLLDQERRGVGLIVEKYSDGPFRPPSDSLL